MVGVAAASTEAWLHRGGSRHVAGTLQISGGRVSFVTPEGIVFDASAADVRTRWPWYYLGAGLKLTIGRNTYSLCFAPPDARLTHLASARRAGKTWRGLLRA